MKGRALSIVLLIAGALALGVLGGALLASGDDDPAVAVQAGPTQAAGTPNAEAHRPPPEDARSLPAVEAGERLTDREVERAAAAAVRIAGQGTAVEVERSEDPGETYEVEVITPAGEIDVALDADFGRVPNAPYDDD